jgi:hypothetical protein
MLDVAFGRVDARFAGIEPGAAVVQLQHSRQPHVGVGIGERSVEHRHDPGEREHRLAERTAGERDQDQPAERPVGAGGDGRVRRHRSSFELRRGAGSMAAARKVCAKPLAQRLGDLCARQSAAMQNQSWLDSRRAPI